MSPSGYFIYLFSILVSLILGLFVFLRNPRSIPNRHFSFLIGALVLWLTTLLVYYLIQDSYLLLVVGRINFVSSLFIAYFFFTFVYFFPTRSIIIKRLYHSLLMCFLLIVSLLTLFTSSISQSELAQGTERATVFGEFYFLYIFALLGYILLGASLLGIKIKRSSGIIRLQLLYIFFGFVVSFGLGLTTNLLFPFVFGIYSLQPYGPLASILFVGFISYVIIRHRFFDIKFVLSRVISYLFTLFVIFFVYIILVIYLSKILLGEELSIRQETLLVILTMIVAFTFQPIHTITQRYTDKLFFKNRYDPNELLRQLSYSFTDVGDVNSVFNSIYMILNKHMHTSRCAYVLKLPKESNAFVPLESDSQYSVINFGEGTSLHFDPDLVARLSVQNHIISRDELYVQNNSNPDLEIQKIVEQFDQNSIGVALPLYVKNEFIGILFLGIKLSGEPYNQNDLILLETFRFQASVGIQNVMLVSHVTDFNARLRSEVAAATRELQQKNRNLEILRKMDTIIMTTLDPKEISQKIVDTISWELGYAGALLEIIDYKKSLLIPTAVSHTPLIDKASKLLPKPMTELTTELNDSKSLSVQALQLKTKVISSSFTDVFNLIPRPIADTMQKIVGIQGFILYPILSKDQPLGVLTLALDKSPHEITAEEYNLLDAFMDEVAIALENAFLYEESRQVNTMLYESNKELVGLDKMKDEFVSIASHELRTPMTAINGYVWMLLQGKGGEMTEKQRYYLDRVAQSTQRLINLVNDMLSVSRIESGRIQVNITGFDLVAMIKSVHEELQIKADEKKLGFSYSSSQPVITALGDPDKVREVVTNLIGNALKFTETGSVTTYVDIKDGYVRVAVTDTGRGVAQEDMPRLFKKFGRLDNGLSVVATTSGTGLGLYICKKYVEAMKGDFEVRSELGKGSTFMFWIPVQPV